MPHNGSDRMARGRESLGVGHLHLDMVGGGEDDVIAGLLLAWGGDAGYVTGPVRVSCWDRRWEIDVLGERARGWGRARDPVSTPGVGAGCRWLGRSLELCSFRLPEWAPARPALGPRLGGRRWR